MQQDTDLLNALRTDLAELTALHAPSGAEQSVIARLRDLFTPLVDAVSIDHMGNLTATREGSPGAPHLVVSAHADEIGAMIASIEPDGFLRLLPIGGVQPRLLEGRSVWVGGRPGVIGARTGHLTPRSEYGQSLSLADLYVDLGVDSAAEVEALGVRVGDPVVVLSELRTLAGARVAGKGIDNRASCVLLLHLLRRLQGSTLSHRLTALVTVQEEVGLRGAEVAYARLRPDLAIVVDTFPAAGTPDTRHLAYTARIGQGALITPASGAGEAGFLLPRAARDALKNVWNLTVVAARKVGRERKRTQAWVTIPKIPSEPSHMRSGAGPAPEAEKRRDSMTPRGVTACRLSTRSSMCVYRVAKCPPARVAIQPPSVEYSND
jgi:putative aminopeptidase